MTRSDPPDRSQPVSWHASSLDDVLTATGSRVAGLSQVDAEERLAAAGPNRLTPSPPASAVAIFVSQFKGVVTLLLVAAAVVSLAMRDLLDAAAIGVVIALNALLGFALELRARRAMEALLGLTAARATVLRDAQVISMDAEGIVTGDVIQLSAGQTVPADARLIQEADLRTNEAALTGESLPVAKQGEGDLPDSDAPLADRFNMVYAGTTVTAGIGSAVVTATANETEVGRIGTLTSSMREEPTPLERRLDALGRRLAALALGIAALVGLLGMAQGGPVGLMLETAIALAVAAVPEGLPAVATIALAIGLRRMARRQALVRRLSAVEALGSTSVVCTDKTRTLTTGDMSIAGVWTCGVDHAVDGTTVSPPDEGVAKVLRIATQACRPVAAGLSTNASAPPDDPVDAAILQAAASLGVDPERVLERVPDALIPFSSERKFTAVFFAEPAGFAAAAKGAPRTMLEMCTLVETPRGAVPLSSTERDAVQAANDRFASDGLRVLGVASGHVDQATEAALHGLTFVGLLGMMDPPAPGVRETIARLHGAGLRIVMLTGDQRRTAETIGRRLGLVLSNEDVVDSREWRTLPPDVRTARLGTIAVVSRITAEDKLAIVAALQRQRQVVAMLGDGVNDAPALRKADVGVAMGARGTDVARGAAAVVLKDDRFETIAAAVEEGRIIADNIRKFVFFLFSCNLAEVLVLLIAGLLGRPLPLLPLQILWLNLVTDTFPALALAMEPGDRDVMKRPPRGSDDAIMTTRFLTSVLFYASLIVAGVLGVLLWAGDRASAQTMVFMTLALAQIFHLGNARSEDDVLRPRTALSNPAALAAVGISSALQVLPIYVSPFDELLHVNRLSLQEWMVVGAGASVAAIVGQGLRMARRSWRAPLGRCS